MIDGNIHSEWISKFIPCAFLFKFLLQYYLCDNKDSRDFRIAAIILFSKGQDVLQIVWIHIGQYFYIFFLYNCMFQDHHKLSLQAHIDNTKPEC